MFLCRSMILEAEGDDAAAGWAAMRAAWACDDAGGSYADAAVRCRLRAVSLYMEARRCGQVFAEGPGAEEAILADLLRRSGRHREGLAMVEGGLASRPDETLRSVLLFQQHLCRRQDDGCHTVEEALRWVARAGTEDAVGG